MDCWQLRTLDRLRRALPSSIIELYGSAATPELLDGWSDLDVVVHAAAPFDVARVLGGTVWSFQDSSDKDGDQTVRVVMADGRRVDLSVPGGGACLPAPTTDNSPRFDSALAASRFGRGADLIGLHLVLGVLRDALVQSMLRADHLTGTSHHRSSTALDTCAGSSLELLRAPLGPGTALAVYRHYSDVRAEVDPTYVPDLSGLSQVLALGSDDSSAEAPTHSA